MSDKQQKDFLYVFDKISDLLVFSENSRDIIYTLVVYPVPLVGLHPTDEQKIIQDLINRKVLQKYAEDEHFYVGEKKMSKSGGFSLHLSVNVKELNKLRNKLISVKPKLEANKLTIYSDGKVVYLDENGKVFNTTFKTTSNSFAILQALSQKPGNIYRFTELEKYLDTSKINNYDSPPAEDRRVRDAKQAIKRKLGYKGDGPFKVDKGLGLKCIVEHLQ